MSSVINCNLYDYLELASIYSIKVKINIEDHDAPLEGVITELKIKDTTEILVLASDDRFYEIPTVSLVRIIALTANPHFEELDFSRQSYCELPMFL